MRCPSRTGRSSFAGNYYFEKVKDIAARLGLAPKQWKTDNNYGKNITAPVSYGKGRI
jgi:hypothetical protein